MMLMPGQVGGLSKKEDLAGQEKRRHQANASETGFESARSHLSPPLSDSALKRCCGLLVKGPLRVS